MITKAEKMTILNKEIDNKSKELKQVSKDLKLVREQKQKIIASKAKPN